MKNKVEKVIILIIEKIRHSVILFDEDTKSVSGQLYKNEYYWVGGKHLKLPFGLFLHL